VDRFWRPRDQKAGLHEGFASPGRGIDLGQLRYARRSASLGGVDSLAVHPASMWRGMLSEDQIAASGVPLGLVRLAAGTEDTPDLVADARTAADALLSEGP
jgi:methionine-gamma-lyase